MASAERLHEVAEQARRLSDELFTDEFPCGRQAREGDLSCCQRERARLARSLRGFEDYDPARLCGMCLAHWHAARCAQVLRGARLRAEEAEAGAEPGVDLGAEAGRKAVADA